MSQARILVARQDKVVQVRIIGRATFKVSRELREYGIKVIREGVKTVIIDLSGCKGMDSTFLGVLAMIGLEARDSAAVLIVNADEQHRRLLDGIGISRLFEFAESRTSEGTWQELCEAAAEAANMEDVADTIVEAHRTLMDISPDNVPKFKDVVEMLSSEMRKPTSKGDDET